MSATPPFVLASTSPYRRELLARLGLAFEADGPLYDEEPLALAPRELALAHAVGKARSLAARHPDALILGSDQLVSLDGEILGKPGTPEAAFAQLRRLAGRDHELITAIALYDAAHDRLETDVDIHILRLRPLSDAAIRRYIERDRPLNCAGSYKLESLGIALFASISGEDNTAVVGLPLMRLVALLRRFGIDPLGL